MIYIDEAPFKMTRFPDGTRGKFDFDFKNSSTCPWKIDWRYESDEEMVELMYIVNHIRQNFGNKEINLFLNYIPNARMDRTKDRNKEIFTLKYFCEFINSLKFDNVYVLDPHSDVCVALLDRVRVREDQLKLLINRVLNNIYYIEQVNPTIYFPDIGAVKRYSGMECFKNYTYVYGVKTRDWLTGKINGIKVCDKDGIVIFPSTDEKKSILENVPVLMVDDIVSYGGTLAHSADKLKELGAGNIYAYATHAENSVIDEEKGTLLKKFQDETVKMLFTSNSLFNKESEYVKVIKI